MEISFDPAKSERNARERGLPFERAEDFDFNTALIKPTLRHGEERQEALGYFEDRLHIALLQASCWRQHTGDQLSQGKREGGKTVWIRATSMT